ncbi:SET and MYND domain-containing protein 4 [Orchesella cincta]|uniref:SET and MYND domain-containing protein 4 n=1 Tax=Orchesella cincta TaxID=48709 RepID=A0A1D2MQ94_ORCCI|nr:SET and MYND domain-containing protein 4 [Orchesella cincta]
MAVNGLVFNCIVEGKTYENGVETNHLERMYRKFCENAEKGEEAKLNIFGKTETERVQIIKQFFEWIPVPDSYLKRFQKSSEIATALRDYGNKAYLEEDYGKALRAFNLAIGFAIPGGPELAMAYVKRADLFLTLNEPDLAQRDINLAAKHAYPKKAAQKLIDLQNRCVAVANRKNANVNVKNTKIINEARRFCDDKFFKLKSPHQTIQNVEEFVDIDYRSECGRRVVVNRDIPAGTVMLVDSPYAFILENLLKWDTEHCHYCSRPIRGGVPCTSCTFAWFCSDSCCAKACTGMHRNEHKYLPYLQCHPMQCRVVTAARVIFTVGPEELYRLYETKDPIYFSAKSGASRGYNKAGIYEVDSYLPIFHLIAHPPSKFVKDLSDTFKALLMTHVIEQTTDFFRKPKYSPNCNVEDFKDFVASVFLRHMRSFEFNAITLSKLHQPVYSDPNNNTNPNLANMKTLRYGAAVYPVLCLLNHSCDPNAVPVRSLRHARTSVVALKNLKRGDEICISYTPLFTLQDTPDRIKYLLDRYNFFCACDACNHCWSNANRTNSSGESHCDKCHRYLLSGQCPACMKRDICMPQIVESLRKQASQIEKLLEGQLFKEAEKLASECLEACEGFSSCFSLFIDLQFLYKRALVGLFNQ